MVLDRFWTDPRDFRNLTAGVYSARIWAWLRIDGLGHVIWNCRYLTTNPFCVRSFLAVCLAFAKKGVGTRYGSAKTFYHDINDEMR